MTKHNVRITIVPPILKDLIQQLLSSRANFECKTSERELFIRDVTNFSLDSSNAEAMYRIQIETENNTKDLFIAKENVIDFYVFFQ